MVEITKKVSAGTLESSDVYVEIEPAKQGLTVEIQSVVQAQFGTRIEETVRQVLAEQGVERALVRVMDRGALDCVICARVEAAVLRGKGEV